MSDWKDWKFPPGHSSESFELEIEQTAKRAIAGLGISEQEAMRGAAPGYESMLKSMIAHKLHAQLWVKHYKEHDQKTIQKLYEALPWNTELVRGDVGVWMAQLVAKVDSLAARLEAIEKKLK